MKAASKMANDIRRSRKAKNDESIKLKKRRVTKGASPASISGPTDASSLRRSSRETSSRKQTTENASNTRKSERLEKRKPSSTPLIKQKSERIQKQMVAIPRKGSDRGKKHTSSGSLGSKKFDEEPASSNTKSKKGKVGRSSKRCVVDTSKDSRHEKQDLDAGGRKRKRVDARIYKELFKPQRIKIEAGDDNDEESQDKLSQANFRSDGDVDKKLKRPLKLHQLDNSKNEYSGSKSMEDKDDGGDECSDRTGEESSLKASKRQSRTSYSGLRNFDAEKVPDDVEVEESDFRQKFSSAEGHKTSLNSRTVEGVIHHVVKEPLGDRLMDLEQVGHDCSSRKSLDGESTEIGREPIGGKGSSSRRETSKRKTTSDTCANIEDNPISHRSLSPGCKRHGHDETCLACSKKPRKNVDLGKHQELDCCDTTCNTDVDNTSSSKDRRTCEAAGLTETVEKNNIMSRMGMSICNACKLGRNLRCCDTVGCNRCYHLSCLDPPVKNVPSGTWCCPFCAKNIKSSVPSVSGVAESIWDAREVEVSDAEGLQKQKQYFVKYKGLAHIHNQWVTEAQLLIEAPLLVEIFCKKDSMMKWTEAWTVPHQLLKKRLVLSLKPLYESQQNAGKVLNHHYEWLVKWQGLDYEQATWESENTSVLDSPEGHDLIQEYENHHGKADISASQVDENEELPVKLPTIPAGCPPGMDNIHLSYVKNLHDAWNKRQNNIVFDDQERTMRVILFILSLKGVTLPFLLITSPNCLSQWEAMFLRVAPCNGYKVSIEDIESQRSAKLVEFQVEGGQLAFQVLLYPVDVFIEDLNLLKAIKWEAVIVDESQSSEISTHFCHIKSLSANKRLLVFFGPLGVSMAGYLDLLSLLKCDDGLPSCVRSMTESDEISKQKETLSRFIAYECKSSSSKFVEFWVPVQISNVQLEQYCSMLLSNDMALGSCSKTDTFGALHDILVSNRKCCDHPYIVDQYLQGVITKDLEPAKFLDVGIKASGKLQFLDLILPEMRKRQLRVLILFQPLSGLGRDSISIGDILDDFVRQRFGEDAYERIDGIGTIPSKKQAALNNFNNKDMGRFIFLLEYRACLPSIKLSAVDTIVIFDSDWNPANDLKALLKITIDSPAEKIMIFRLYTSWTLEEKILRLAEHHVTIDSKLQNLSRSTTDALLMWGATYLFNKLAEFHSTSVLNTSSEEGFWKELTEEFLSLISHECKSKDTAKLIIKRVQQSNGTYGTNLPLPSEPITQLSDEEQPHLFWRTLLKGRKPHWKYLSRSTPRQRKRPQYFEKSPKIINAGNADVGSKRKKAADSIIKPVASKPVIEEGEIGGAYTASRVPSHDGSQLSPGDSLTCAAICDETSFRHLLKLNISKLCEVLKLSEDVKIMVERFLEYVIENYRVNKEPSSTLQAFLISLCWIGSALLKHKLDRRQSLALAKKHLNFSCKEEEANSVYLKLEPAKEMFLCHMENQNKTDVSKDPLAAAQAASTQPLDPRMSQPGPLNSEGVKVEILESPDNQYVDVTESSLPAEEIPAKKYEGVPNDGVKQFDSVGMSVLAADTNIEIAEAGAKVSDGHDREGLNDINPNDVEGHVGYVGMEVLAADCNQKNAEDGTISPDASDALVHQNESCSSTPSAAASKEKVPSVQPFVSPPSSQSVPTNREIQNECIRDKEVQGNPSPLAEICTLQTMDAGNVDQSNSEDPSLDRHEEPCFPLSSNPAVAENMEEHTHVSAETPVGEQQPDLHSADRVDCQPSCERQNPSQNPEGPPQLLGITEETPNQAATPPGASLANVQGLDNHNQGASQTCCQSRSSSDPLQAELEILHKLKDTVTKSHEDIKLKLKSDYDKELAETIAQLNLKYVAKRMDAEAKFQLKKKEVEISFNRVVMNKILAEAFRSKCQDLSLSDLAGIQQVTPSGLMQNLRQFPVQPPLRRSAGITSSSQSSASQPPLQIVHKTAELFSSTPNRPSSSTNPSSMPSRPPSNINPITSTSTPSRPPSIFHPVTPTSKPSRPTPNINPIIPSSIPSGPLLNISPITPLSRPLPSINHATPSARNLRISGEIRAPAPHIRPFTPSTSVPPIDLASHGVMPSQLASSSLPPSSPTFSQASARPPLPINHDGPQNSPRSLPRTCPLLAQASSHPPSRSQSPPPPPPASVPRAPPASFRLPSLSASEQRSPGTLPATSTSLPEASPQISLPSIPSVSINHTGLYSASPGPASRILFPTPDILSLPALDLLKDVNKQAAFHQMNTLPSPPDISLTNDLTESGKEIGADMNKSLANDLVCLSDDD